MKNTISLFAQHLFGKFLTPEEIVKEIPSDRREAALSAWETRHAAGEGGSRLMGAVENDLGLQRTHFVMSTARGAMDHVLMAKGRHEITGKLMDAMRYVKEAGKHAGHYGHRTAALSARELHADMARHIDEVFDQKLDQPDVARIANFKDRIDTFQSSISRNRDERGNYYEHEGKGAIPHTRARKPGDGSLTHEFHGDVEIRGKREDLRQRLKKLGFGRVDLVKKEDPTSSLEHELWENPDGRAVRISHTRHDTEGHTLSVKERSPERFHAMREEFVRSYGGNPALNEKGARPGRPPKGVRVGMESELPLMPEDRPMKKGLRLFW